MEIKKEGLVTIEMQDPEGITMEKNAGATSELSEAQKQKKREKKRAQKDKARRRKEEEAQVKREAAQV